MQGIVMYYNVMQCNIYFRKNVWEQFETEEKKSELVNKLLEKHYGLEATEPDKAQPKVEEALNLDNYKF